LEPTGEHRVARDLVALQGDQQKFALSPDRDKPLPDEATELSRGASDGQWTWCLGRPDEPPGKGGMERVGDDAKIGQFGHGWAIVAVGGRVLDSPGPKRQDS